MEDDKKCGCGEWGVGVFGSASKFVDPIILSSQVLSLASLVWLVSFLHSSCNVRVFS